MGTRKTDEETGTRTVRKADRRMSVTVTDGMETARKTDRTKMAGKTETVRTTQNGVAAGRRHVRRNRA